MADARSFNERIIDEFRANAGVVGGPFEGAPMVLLTTTGRRSGQPRTMPLVPLEADDGRLFVFASAAGAHRHPAWYDNLVADPAVTVERGTDRYAATAVVITGPERDAIYARQAELRPQFADYQAGTSRQIPVVELRPA